LAPGDYTVFVTDVNGCENQADFTITQPDTLQVILTSPIILLPDFNISEYQGEDGSIDGQVSGGTQPYLYSWAPDLEGPEDTIFTITGLTAETYCLEVTDANGCVSGQCIELVEPQTLTLPNGASPNGDGLNDGLIIQGLEAFPDNAVKVFNRWGDVVFEQTDYANSDPWRGEGTNGDVPDGTYFVILTVSEDGGDRQLSGYLELRR